MKFITIGTSVVSVVFFVSLIQGLAAEEKDPDLEKCIKDNNAPASLVQKLDSDEKITDRPSLCALACYYEKLGMVSANNQVNVKLFEEFLSEDSTKEKASAVANTCSKVGKGIADKCDFAGALTNCIAENTD